MSPTPLQNWPQESTHVSDVIYLLCLFNSQTLFLSRKLRLSLSSLTFSLLFLTLSFFLSLHLSVTLSSFLSLSLSQIQIQSYFISTNRDNRAHNTSFKIFTLASSKLQKQFSEYIYESLNGLGQENISDMLKEYGS